MVEKILPLEISNASVEKRGKRIIGPINHSLSQQGFTVVMGPNGSGKTTFLRLLHGLENPRGGMLEWNCKLHEARLQQSFVFQTPILLRRTAVENIAYPLQLRGMSKTQAVQESMKWISKINLEHSANINSRFLSGGEKQKLALARALSIKPQLLFLDEPSANLDGSATREIEALLMEARQSGTRIMMATHDVGQAKRMAEDVIFLYRGQVHEISKVQEFFKNPNTKEAASFLKGDILE